MMTTPRIPSRPLGRNSVGPVRFLATAWAVGAALLVAWPMHRVRAGGAEASKSSDAAALPPAPALPPVPHPLLDSYCAQCHNATKHKGHVDLSLLTDGKSILRQKKVLRKAVEQLESGQMPPEDEEKQPGPRERQALLEWTKAAASATSDDPADRDPGPSPLRRLSLAEYNNTVRDLLGVEFDGAEAVGMTDESGGANTYGNLAAALDTSPALMDKYFAAADKVLDRFFGTELSSQYDGTPRDRARAKREALFGFKPGAWKEAAALPPLPDGLSERDAAKAAIAKLLPRAYRRPVGGPEIDELMKLYDHSRSRGASFLVSVRLAFEAILVAPKFLYRVPADDPGTAAAGQPDRLKPAGAAAGAARRVDDHELASRLSYFLWSSMPDEQLAALADKKLLTKDGPSDEPTQLPGVAISSVLAGSGKGNSENTLDKAFDGDPFTAYESPPEQGREPGGWMGLDLGEPKKVTQIRYAGSHNNPGEMEGGRFQVCNAADFADAIDLFTIPKGPQRGEVVGHDVSVPNPYRYVRYVPKAGRHPVIGEMEVWGVAGGTVLEQQVRRMLASSRARALTDNFAARWLQINKLAGARPSTEFFPEFQPDVRKAMYDEAALFFDHLRIEDRSVLDLLDADYTYVNEDLAKYYKIPGVRGKEMRRVTLEPEYHRGGLLGMGGVLALTSQASRTSPTLRGNWVLTVILGTPPPPPPANAGMFKDEQDKSKQPQTFRERMAMHARNPSCAGCHRKMDPLGFALENYNAAGVWRDDDRGRPLDNAGELPTGEKLQGVAGLKRIVLDRKGQFIHNLAEQLLVYATGRELNYYDEGPVKEIEAEAARGNGRFSAMVLGVVKSYPFQYRREVEDAKE